MRNRALIAHWVLEHAGTVAQLTKRQGKTFLHVSDYAALRPLFGTLLREIQRIKSEGDYEAARLLVEQYGIKVDPSLHEEVRQRYVALHLAPYKGFLNPWLKPVFDAEGTIIDVVPDYSESYEEQMLRYSREYGFL